MEYKEVLSILKEIELKKLNIIKTLGGGSTFTFKTNETTFSITNSKNKTIEITEGFWNKVVARYNQVSDVLKMKAKQYTVTGWEKNNPSTVYSPYVVALIRLIENLDRVGCSDLIKRYKFYKIGCYKLENNKVISSAENNIKVTERKPLVYMLCLNNKCMYIGKTIQGYSRPLNYHKNVVMRTVYEGIQHEVIENGDVVYVYALHEGLTSAYLDLRLNLAEAVEQALISKYQPNWNNFIQ